MARLKTCDAVAYLVALNGGDVRDLGVILRIEPRDIFAYAQRAFRGDKDAEEFMTALLAGLSAHVLVRIFGSETKIKRWGYDSGEVMEAVLDAELSRFFKPVLKGNAQRKKG